jgi:hypothetical protein
MRVGLMAENPLERAIFATGIVPLAMLEGYAPAYSRAILTATRWEFRLAERPTDRPRRRGLVGRVAHPVQTRCLRTRVVGHSGSLRLRFRSPVQGAIRAWIGLGVDYRPGSSPPHKGAYRVLHSPIEQTFDRS